MELRDSPPAQLIGAQPRVLVLEARFYPEISKALREGAEKALAAAQVSFEVAGVPGALEIPPAIAMAHRSAENFDGYVALGCVIRGETSHYDIVAGQSAQALLQLAVTHGLAIGNGILTVENEAQAFARARADKLDKGGGAVRACLALIAWKRRLETAKT